MGSLSDWGILEKSLMIGVISDIGQNASRFGSHITIGLFGKVSLIVKLLEVRMRSTHFRTSPLCLWGLILMVSLPRSCVGCW